MWSLVTAEVRSARNGILDRSIRDDRRHLLAVKQLDDRLADRRLVVELRESISELAHVGHRAFESLVRSHDAGVIPHRVLNRGPVLQDPRTSFHVLAAR